MNDQSTKYSIDNDCAIFPMIKNQYFLGEKQLKRFISSRVSSILFFENERAIFIEYEGVVLYENEYIM